MGEEHFNKIKVTPLGARSSMDDVRAVSEMSKGLVGNLGVESLAFVYGVARLDNNTEVISEVENLVNNLKGTQGVALRTSMGLILAESFSDAYLVWNKQGLCPEPTPELQNKTTDWIIEGLTSEQLSEGQKTLLRPVVINLLGRIGEEVGESILDEEQAERIIESANISDEEIENHQQALISQLQVNTVSGVLREVFGKIGE